MNEPAENPDDTQNKELIRLQRKLGRAEQQLVDYERLVDRTQHLLNTRINEVEAARKKLAESEQRFRQLADAAFEAIIIHADGIIMDCNDAAKELYSLSKNELIGRPILERVHRASKKHATKWLHESTQEAVEVDHVRSDGTPIPVEVRSREIIHRGQPALVTAVRDITTFREMEEKLKHIANSDPLTGVGNRRFFMDVGQREFSRATRYAHPLTLMMFDVDHFKRINDTYGHDIGDDALRDLTKVTIMTLRDSDVLARVGGEEFAVVLPGTDLVGAAALAERLRRNVESSRTRIEGGEIRFTISIGLTDIRDQDRDIETMLNRADEGLYRAKKSGRNRVETE